MYETFLNDALEAIHSNIQRNVGIFREAARGSGPGALIYNQVVDTKGRALSTVDWGDVVEIEQMYTNEVKVYSERLGSYTPKCPEAYILLVFTSFDGLGRKRHRSKLYVILDNAVTDTGLQCNCFGYREKIDTSIWNNT